MLDGSKESVDLTWCSFGCLKAILRCSLVWQCHTAHQLPSPHVPPSPATSAELAKLWGMKLWLGSVREEKGHPEGAPACLGVFSSLIEFVDVVLIDAACLADDF